MSYIQDPDELGDVPPAWEWMLCAAVVVGLIVAVAVLIATGNWLGEGF